MTFLLNSGTYIIQSELSKKVNIYTVQNLFHGFTCLQLSARFFIFPCLSLSKYSHESSVIYFRNVLYEPPIFQRWTYICLLISKNEKRYCFPKPIINNQTWYLLRFSEDMLCFSCVYSLNFIAIYAFVSVTVSLILCERERNSLDAALILPWRHISQRPLLHVYFLKFKMTVTLLFFSSPWLHTCIHCN